MSQGITSGAYGGPSSFGTSPSNVYSQQLNQLGLQQSYASQLANQQAASALKAQGAQSASNQSIAQLQANSQLAQANAAAGASRYGSDAQLRAVQAQIDQKNSRFNQIFPLLTSSLGSIQGLASGSGGGNVASIPGAFGSGAGAGGAAFGSSAGSTGGGGNYGYGPAAPPPPSPGGSFSGGERTAPGVSQSAGGQSYESAVNAARQASGANAQAQSQASAPVISQDQLRQNINASNAQNWSQAAGQTRRQSERLAGGGLGAQSPLAKALNNQIFGSALAANTRGETEQRQQAAQLNAADATERYKAQQVRDAAIRSATLSSNASMYGSDRSAGASQYGSQLGYQSALAAANANQYGSQLGYQSSLNNNATSRYGSDLNYQAALAGVNAQRQNAILGALASFAGSG